MPDPVKAPPKEEVNQEKTNLTLELDEMFKNENMAYQKQREIANEAISRLAYLRALLKYNEIEFE